MTMNTQHWSANEDAYLQQVHKARRDGEVFSFKRLAEDINQMFHAGMRIRSPLSIRRRDAQVNYGW